MGTNSFVTSILSLLTLAFAADKINVTKEAFAITQKNCEIIKDENTGPPIMFAAADLVIIGKSGAVGAAYGEGNTKYEIFVTPHCILKGSTDKKSLKVRNMGKGVCGGTDVEKNDLMPYLFFLRATSDPMVFEALNLGAKRILDPMVVWSTVFPMFCKVTNKKVCTGNACAKACGFEPMPPGGCIPYEQNVIDEIKKEQAKKKAMSATTEAPTNPTTKAAMPTTKAPMPTTPTMKKEDTPMKKEGSEKVEDDAKKKEEDAKKTEETTTKMTPKNLDGKSINYEAKEAPKNEQSSVGTASNTQGGGSGSGSVISANCFVIICSSILSRLI